MPSAAAASLLIAMILDRNDILTSGPSCSCAFGLHAVRAAKHALDTTRYALRRSASTTRTSTSQPAGSCSRSQSGRRTDSRGGCSARKPRAIWGPERARRAIASGHDQPQPLVGRGRGLATRSTRRRQPLLLDGQSNSQLIGSQVAAFVTEQEGGARVSPLLRFVRCGHESSGCRAYSSRRLSECNRTDFGQHAV
jgi:hypothetical protein